MSISEDNQLRLLDIAKMLAPSINVDKIEDMIEFFHNLNGAAYHFVTDMLKNYLYLQTDGDVLMQMLIGMGHEMGKDIPKDVRPILIPANTEPFVKNWSPFLLKALEGDEITVEDVLPN